MSKILETFLVDRSRLGGDRIEIPHDMSMLLVDGDVVKLRAYIKSATYKGLNSDRATGHGHWDVYHSKSVGKGE